MKNKLILMFLMLIFSVAAFAQQNILTGTVKDNNGEPLYDAAVAVEGTPRGTIVGANGEFSLSVKPGETIVVTSLGYETYSFKVGNRTHIDVVLESANIQLESAVVIGYGTQKRTDVVSSVADVSGVDIRQTGLSNITHAIQDALPGVIATMNSGQPGADDAALTVRGLSTFGSSNEPLVLVDGVEVSGGFSAINPGEISSISVLKDASATSIYGSKGANGVILITTRRGEEGGAPSITFSGSITAKSAINLPDQVESYDALMLGQEAAKNSGSSGIGFVRSQSYIDAFQDPYRDQCLYPNVDWYEELVKPVAFEESARVTVSGGTKKVKYFSSLSYDHAGDIMNVTNVYDTYDPRYAYDKFNFRTNLDFEVTETTSLRVDVAGRTSTSTSPIYETNDIMNRINGTTAFMMPIYYSSQFIKDHPDPLDPDAHLDGVRIANGGLMIPAQTSPFFMLNYYGFQKNSSQVVDMKVGLDQKLDFITKGLAAYGTFNYSTIYNYRKMFRYLSASDISSNAHSAEPVWSYNPQTETWNGTAYNEVMSEYHPEDQEDFKSTSRNLFYEVKLAYNRSFNKRHNVDAVAVMNRTIYYGNVGDFAAYLENWVGRASYNYDSRYFIEFSGAYNGTDKFASGRKFGFFPAVAIGYNIANEKFIKDNVDFIDLFKLRLSYGITGSEGAATTFMYEGGWSINGNGATFKPGYPSTGINFPRYYESDLPNIEATWEEAYKSNFGIDAQFFNKSLTMTMDVYRESRERILVTPPSTIMYNPGYGGQVRVSLPMVNKGMMKSQGVEFSANYNGKINQDLSYNVGGNFNYADNRVIYKADLAKEYEYLKNAGKPSGWIKGYQTTGYATDFEDQINSTNSATYKQGGTQPGTYVYTDFNLDGFIDQDDMIPMDGTSQPMCVYGFNLGVNYKKWSLSARFYGKSGVTYGSNSAYLYPAVKDGAVVAQEEHMGNVWSFDNQNAKYPAVMSYVDNLSYQTNNMNLVDGSYFKLKSISLRYLLTSSFLQDKLLIQNASVYLTGDNLYSWSNLPYGDPEGGNSFGKYPLTRRFVLGLDLNF